MAIMSLVFEKYRITDMMVVYVASRHNVVMETLVMTLGHVHDHIMAIDKTVAFFVFDGMIITTGNTFLHIVKCGHDSCNYYAFDELQLLLYMSAKPYLISVDCFV